MNNFHTFYESVMDKKDKGVCCKCKEDIVGFVAHKDKDGNWCEDCTNEHTCDECGEIQDRPVQSESDGKCDNCAKSE